MALIIFLKMIPSGEFNLAQKFYKKTLDFPDKLSQNFPQKFYTLNKKKRWAK